jgi:arylsulfatase A-like enzyme
VCSPARGALLTGCYPPRIGFGQFEGLPVLFPGMGVGLPPTEISLARILSDAGYATCAVGKWHCGDQPHFQPTNHGFDRYVGLPYSNDMGRQVGRPKAFGVMPPLPLIVDGEVVEQQPDQATLTDRYVAECLEFIGRSEGRPFFLYLAHMYVHLPIYVQERFARQSTNGRYGAAVESIDWATEVILAELEARGLADDTIVIFTSDNGSLGDNPPPFGSPEPLGGSNDPLRGTKGTTWEGGQRVPGIVRWPGRIEPGRTSGEVVTAMDLYPTLAALCGADVPTDRVIDGRDISDLWFGDAPSPHDAFYYYWQNDLEAVRAGRWKMHFAKKGEPVDALFDLVDDIGETTDVLAANPEVAARLGALAERARATLGDARLGRVGSEVRPIGRVDDPAPLTVYDPDHPYFMAEYDLPDLG